jgi:hypothetical protein
MTASIRMRAGPAIRGAAVDRATNRGVVRAAVTATDESPSSRAARRVHEIHSGSEAWGCGTRVPPCGRRSGDRERCGGRPDAPLSHASVLANGAANVAATSSGCYWRSDGSDGSSDSRAFRVEVSTSETKDANPAIRAPTRLTNSSNASAPCRLAFTMSDAMGPARRVRAAGESA